MLDVIGLVLPLFGLIFLGYGAGRLTKIPVEGLAWMNFFIIYVALPAMFFKLLSKTPIEQFANISFIAVSVLSTLLVFVTVFLIAGLLNKGNVAGAMIQGFAAAYGNIGYMGPPLAITAFGLQAGVPVALIFCFENTMHFILAPFLMSLHEETRKSTAAIVKEVCIKIVSHPFIIATIIGVLAAVFKIELPVAGDKLITFLANAAAPCALFTMGVTAALRPLKRVPMELGYIVPFKLIIHPALVYGLMILIVPDLDPVWLYSAVILAALPSATNVFVIAQQYGVWQERASSAVIVTTFLAVFSLTGILYLMLG